MKKFTIKLDVDNIGPHYGNTKLSFSDDVESNKAVIFAMNGTGKSFISRGFRLTAPEKMSKVADDLLTLGQQSGTMSFRIVSGTQTKELLISIVKGTPPTITNNTGFIFHVFNSNYVEENIKPRHYTPDGNIEGYILGKTQIDLHEEREREDLLRKEIEAIQKTLDAAVNKARQELRAEGIPPRITEFSLIEKGRLRGDEQVDSVPPFYDIVAQLEALSKAPDDLADIVAPSLSVDTTVFDNAITLLSTQYPKTEWDEEFVASLKANRYFIEEGLNLAGDSMACPFCRQPYDGAALKLVGDYKAYLSDKEADLQRQLEHCTKTIGAVVSKLKATEQATKSTIADITSLQQYYPSLAKTALLIPDIGNFQGFTFVLEQLELKSNNLSYVCQTINDTAQACKEEIARAIAIVKRNEAKALFVNRTKQDAIGERRMLRRDLCRAQYSKYKKDMAPKFAELDARSSSLLTLQASITEKEQQSRVSRREKVYDTLTYFLNSFFAGKYTIDRDTFQIRFLGKNVGDKASSILSDGEKSIVTFCWYLASTHLLVNSTDEYDRLFFVIDDPISSMDFHYVYSVAQSLRDIKAYFGITTHDRIWVFTHNLEFLSIMTRNHIINRKYIMRPGSIDLLEHQLLMPYESHLKDIVEIANGQKTPSHTTANSIRHVLETVSRFEFPERDIGKYIADDNILSNDSCIYTLCQDLSHGGMRRQQSFSPDILIAACKTVETFMRAKYEGQVNAIMPATDSV